MVLLIIIAVVLVVSFFKAGSNKEMDCVNSMINSYGNGCDARLSIILYQKQIENELDVAKEIIKKCEENSFKTIKFSYDMRIPNELKVYYIVHMKTLRKEAKLLALLIPMMEQVILMNSIF